MKFGIVAFIVMASALVIVQSQTFPRIITIESEKILASGVFHTKCIKETAALRYTACKKCYMDSYMTLRNAGNNHKFAVNNAGCPSDAMDRILASNAFATTCKKKETIALRITACKQCYLNNYDRLRNAGNDHQFAVNNAGCKPDAMNRNLALLGFRAKCSNTNPNDIEACTKCYMDAYVVWRNAGKDHQSAVTDATCPPKKLKDANTWIGFNNWCKGKGSAADTVCANCRMKGYKPMIQRGINSDLAVAALTCPI